MRKVLVVTKAFEGKSVGDIINIGPSSVIDGFRGNYYTTHMAKLSVPAEFDGYPITTKIVEEGNELAKYWFKGDEILTVKPEVTAWIENGTGSILYEQPGNLENYTEADVQDPTYIVHPAEVAGINVVIDWEKHFDDQIKTAYELMNASLYTTIPTYFETKDVMAALTWKESWKLKSENPARYTSKGLVVLHTSTSFQTVGEALDTSQKITDHFTELLEERVFPYDDFRDARVLEFVQARAAILLKKEAIPS